MRDLYFAAGLLLALLSAYLFTTDVSKVKVLELMLVTTFGALIALLQARARSTQTGDIVEKKVEVTDGAARQDQTRT